ncbi:MAG: hypothetical protein ABSA83_16420 [Verrucomicrobiota bacterium]|jgi:hypothetical protein
MARCWIFAFFLLLLAGCGESDRMAQSEDPQGCYHEQIAAAKRLLEQREDWADRAEWEVRKTADGWQVTAWRVEHPEARGSSRYVPWGYSVIELDSRMLAMAYHRKG